MTYYLICSLFYVDIYNFTEWNNDFGGNISKRRPGWDENLSKEIKTKYCVSDIGELDEQFNIIIN